jgi:hypothetical protein
VNANKNACRATIAHGLAGIARQTFGVCETLKVWGNKKAMSGAIGLPLMAWYHMENG